MNLLNKAKGQAAQAVNSVLDQPLVKPEHFIYPPNSEFGDLSLACFDIAKVLKKNPAEVARVLAEKIKPFGEISGIKAVGPYLNFTLDKTRLTEGVLKEIAKEKSGFGRNKNGEGKKLMIEYAHPNTHKAFHIGHLRNIITGEAIARLMEANGHEVIRANYQGDVGLHIAKCLWGINRLMDEYKAVADQPIEERVKFLGKAYALGSQNYEEKGEAQAEIVEINKKIYTADKSLVEVYKITRAWSLEYFDKIYDRLGTKFDRLYFESETQKPGKELVLKSLEKGIFKNSDGAVIFEGEKFGLHNRVFINSEGFPTYEAKDMGLAQLQFKEFKPEKIIHTVATEQTEYFKVIFKALGQIFPELDGREIHLPYGWVRLKEGKMSSRLGNVVLGEWLIEEIRKKIKNIMAENKNLKNIEEVVEKVSLAAVKYSILKNSINKEIAFDIKESISLSGSSGPYLQYTYARIASILRKAGEMKNKADYKNLSHPKEQQIILKLAKYPEIVEKAGRDLDPSEIAKYFFELSKEVNDYYHDVPVLKAEDDVKLARLALLKTINQVIKNGLELLGIETLEEM